MKNFLNASTFPFAFGPENPLARNAEWISEKTLKMSFNMTTENAPECAAIALIISDGAIPSKINFKAMVGTATILVELKNKQKIKYFEEQVIQSNELLLEKGTAEIVFTCWKACNPNFNGDIIIEFE